MSSDAVSISILGSTGSIGTQVLDVARRLGPDVVRVVGLGAQNNADLLIEQALEFRPRLICIGNEQALEYVRESVGGEGIEVCAGAWGFDELACLPQAGKIVVSVAGAPGLSPTLQAIKAGKDIALASKEVLVAAGHLVMESAKEKGVSILPIDSEHSAIFQCLNGENRDQIDRIYLTASGGAFRDLPVEALASVTPEQALAHPTWKMGMKVTVDSATLMNKGLEIIEAKWLFGVEADQIDVVIHPTSIMHSLVRFADGSLIGQLGLPDMRLPIQYALLFPERVDSDLPKLDMLQTGALEFRPVDWDRYECLKLAMEAAKTGGTLAVVMNAADEAAVELFLSGRIGFLDIARVVGKTMEAHSSVPSPSLEEIRAADAQARIDARAFAGVDDGPVAFF
ncbi:MAG: 1-deoxy-D-xylulose-5-phosphate reductoisomerase [Armatimonadetes bacterium]|jgi:1-deoxy-D-xylulose-5-phosphate reductoisomerase|nr:1-deoxy-D-xylulose-5-phosphate reductoisomerase [Armatimonadota bacterium]